MAVKIRLARGGRNKQPIYRIVVANSESPRDGKFLEKVGTYNPHVEPAAVTIDEEKTLKWLKTGAQPTETVKSLLSKAGLIAPAKAPAKKKAKAPAKKAAEA
ncbi:MAG: 30S ribosomal protein S16 [bacterium]|nr:30S ribosomal protein S16 [bacterium]